MKSPALAFLAIIGASFFFSLPPIITKILYQSIDPIPLAFLRFLIASIVIMPFYFAHAKKDVWKTIIKVIPISIFSSLNILLFYLGIALTTADSSTIIYTDVPLLVAILSYFFLKERLELRKILGILLGFFGICLIVLLPLFQKVKLSGDFSGNMLILAATFSWAIYTIGSRRLIVKDKISPLLITSISFFTSAIVFFAGTLIFAERDFISPVFKGNNFILLLLLGGIATVGSYLLMQWAVKNSSATIASLNQYAQPVFTITLASIFLGEIISTEFTLGAVLVFLGVFIATGAGEKIFKKLKL